MSEMVQRLNICTNHCIAVCGSSHMTLQQHMQAAYLCSTMYIPCMYFGVPPRTFCHLESGNVGSHVEDYSQLYVRACATLSQPAKAFSAGVRARQRAKWDLQLESSREATSSGVTLTSAQFSTRCSTRQRSTSADFHLVRPVVGEVETADGPTVHTGITDT